MRNSPTLALDLGARAMGWACDAGMRPAFGLMHMPGIADIGLLLGSMRNAIEELVLRYEPGRIRFARGFRQSKGTKVAEALDGIQAVMKLVAWDNDVELEQVEERSARKQVLGVGDFGYIDQATGGIIPDSGRAHAKALVMEWCRDKGYLVASHDVGDALVLLAYDPSIKGLPKPRRRQVPHHERGAA